MHVIIALCTRRRPTMLRQSLASINDLTIPALCKLSVVVVENDTARKSEEIIEDIRRLNKNESGGTIDFRYCLEATPGIPFARNTSVEAALALGPDWIAFIDDDEIVPADWLVNFMPALRSGSADVYTGPFERILPCAPPIWYTAPKTVRHDDGTIVPHAATNNTFVRADIFDGRRFSMRFDTKLQFTGGSDTELFHALIAQGGTIRYVAKALIYEHVPPERMTIKWHVNREFRIANNALARYVKHDGRPAVARRLLWRITRRFFVGSMYVFIGFAAHLFNKRAVRWQVKGMLKLAWSFGSLTGFTSYRPQPYRKIEGH